MKKLIILAMILVLVAMATAVLAAPYRLTKLYNL